MNRDVHHKRFSAEDMARFARFLTNSSRNASFGKLTSWFDGPPESRRGRTRWTSRRKNYL